MKTTTHSSDICSDDGDVPIISYDTEEAPITLGTITFHQLLHPAFRLYALPFAVIYICLSLAFYLSNEWYQQLVWVGFVIVVFLQAVSFLAVSWSVRLRTAIEYRTLPDPIPEGAVRIIPDNTLFPAALCPVNIRQGRVFITYQNARFVWDSSQREFHRAGVDETESPIGEWQRYLSEGGLNTAETERRTWLMGANRFDIPIPTFGNLFKEHATSPFFVFQVFCVFLWCMDDYWQYSLLTLVMLVVFESTVVAQRRRNLRQLREMRVPSYEVYVLRHGKWQSINTEHLVPGDIISLVRGARLSSGDHQTVPCDAALLSGTCIVDEALLTGESTPQRKSFVETMDPDSKLDIASSFEHRRYVVFGGTRILDHHSASSLEHDSSSPSPSSSQSNPPLPPDGGVVCCVLRTGFDTSQGRLVRTILHSSNASHSHTNNTEALLFIACLLMFAVAASGYVLVESLRAGDRSLMQILLKCTLILTSVVPPELPMELSLAVNSSLIALSRLRIFCTEPFRIPAAGKVGVACFDKTGTLTADTMVLRGVTPPTATTCPDVSALKTDAVPSDAARVLIGCQALLPLEGELVGDAMEKAAVEGLEAEVSADGVVSQGGQQQLRIVRRFEFDSSLRRMAAIVEVLSTGAYQVVVKGAPETVRELLTDVPEGYDSVHRHLAGQGARVLALAAKRVSWKQAGTKERREAEGELHFLGFAVFECPIKGEASDTVRALNDSSHRVIMITGDNPRTAAHVANRIGIIERPAVVLSADATGTRPVWTLAEEGTPADVTDMEEACQTYDVCLSGDVVSLLDPDWLARHIVNIPVFARFSPKQKETVIEALENAGYVSMMCGDGTNDVGALKRADVGVALLNRPASSPNSQQQQQQQQQRPQPPPRLPPNPSLSQIIEHATAQQRYHQQQQQGMSMDGGEAPMVRLGDASIASPFTSLKSTTTSTLHIIRQGRCTLVTTLQMYIILALNCLVSAYSLSVLYLDGVRYGDTQMFISGIAISMCFLFISRAQPASRLSPERPHHTVFCPYALLTILGQFAVHIYTLITAVNLARDHSPEDTQLSFESATRPIDEEEEFQPNLMNTVVFLVTTAQQLITFAVNYRGKPFMQPLTANRGMLIILVLLGGATLLAAGEASPEIKLWLELADMPSAEFREYLVQLIIGNAVAALAIEFSLRWMFPSPKGPKK
eukprot:gb/GECH01014188.1/.p1 GENE.gb/GECH01014188.1/~~gb/GECH01014188.1/.p1  ORF type:complete len:1187 (+),score=268.83 gb/GECH01014188.1/:1-3561(+)